MKKTIVFLMVNLTLILASCGKEQENTIYVGTNAEYKPFEYMENRKLKGFDIELMEAIGVEAGIKIEWVDMKFDGLIPALNTEKVDAIIAGLSITEDRLKSVDFSDPYLTSDQVVIVKKTAPYKSAADLKGKTMGAQLGSVQEQLGKNMDGVIVKTYDTFTGALLDLKTAKIEFMMVDESVATEYLESNPELRDLAIVDGVSKAIATRKEDKELTSKINDGLQEVKANGQYEDIYNKYF